MEQFGGNFPATDKNSAIEPNRWMVELDCPKAGLAMLNQPKNKQLVSKKVKRASNEADPVFLPALVICI
jgi:hypothetical protein